MPGTTYTHYKHKDELLPPPVGFSSDGKCCWMNAFAQLVMSLTPLRAILNDVTKPPKKSILPAFMAIFNGNIAKFREMFAMFGIEMNNQNCVQEALIKFVDAIGIAPATGLMSVVNKIHTNCACGFERIIPDLRFDIMIFPPAVTNYQEFVERVHGGQKMQLDGYKCEMCGSPIDYNVTRLARVESVIIITFQQFEEKHSHYFPLEFQIPAAANKPPHVFKLVAQIEHAGTNNNGHYWARVLRQNGIFLIDNTAITPSYFSPSKETFMLAYCRIQ